MPTSANAGFQQRLTDFRALFPTLSSRVYLDTASVGLLPASHADVARNYMLTYGAAGSLAPWTESIDVARTALGRLLDAPGDALTLVSSTTEALHLASLAVQWHAGDEVLLLDDEFPSVRYAAAAAERAGGRIVPVARDPRRSRTEQLLDHLGPQTRVLAVSHVHWVTGEKVDLDMLGAACASCDALLVCDGVQALGALPIDLANVDVYAAATYKWLLGGFGCAVLVLGPRAAAELSPSLRGHANVPPSPSLQYSHVNHLGWALAMHSLGLLDQLGWEPMREHVQSLVARLVEGLEPIGLAPVPVSGSTIVSVPVADSDALVKRLAGHGIQVASRERHVRIAPHGYNNAADIDRFLDVMQSLRQASQSEHPQSVGESR